MIYSITKYKARNILLKKEKVLDTFCVTNFVLLIVAYSNVIITPIVTLILHMCE